MVADVPLIVLLSALAGLGTGLGGLTVLVRKPGEKLFVFLTGLAAGLMIMLSFMRLLFEHSLPPSQRISVSALM